MKAKNNSRQMKRILSLALSLALILSVLALGSSAPALAEATVWDGTSDTTFEGAGTEASPYLITSAEELKGFYTKACGEGVAAAFSEAWYELTTDIYLNDVSNENWMTSGAREWVFLNTWTLNNGVTGFRGHFDGKGHTVYGMYYENPNDWAAVMGLIPIASGNAVITNVNLKDAYVKASSYQGYFGIVGFVNKNSNGSASNVSISKCVADSSVNLSGLTNSYAGGICGAVRESYLTVQSCGSAARFNNDGSPAGRGGGIVGNLGGWAAKGCTITDSYCTAAFTTSIGSISASSISNGTLYSVQTWWGTNGGVSLTGVSAANLIGGAAMTAMPNLDWTVWQANDGNYPSIKGSTIYASVEEEDDGEIDIWDGSVAVSYNGGTGAVADPYLIKTPEQLRKAITTTETGKYFLLVDDIYLNDVSAYSAWGTTAPANNWWTWTLNETPFNGHIDGDGHTIYGLYAANDNLGGNKYAGLIANISGGSSITDLHIRKSYIYGVWAGAFVGSICGTNGTSSGTVTVAGCSVGSSVSVTGTYCGGLIGLPLAALVVENCYSVARMGGSGNNGGVYGDTWGGLANHSISNFYCKDCYALAVNGAGSAKCANNRAYESVFCLNYSKPAWENIVCVSAYSDMTLPATYWYGRNAKLLKNRGELILDANADDSDDPDADDLVAMRKVLLGIYNAQANVSNFNGDNSTDIKDLVFLKKALAFFQGKTD